MALRTEKTAEKATENATEKKNVAAAMDTIVAIATPPGVGGVGIVRLSGSAALEIADGMFRPSGKGRLNQAESHRMLHGWVECDGSVVDEVLAVVMRAPRSYTREDVVELQCHGGPFILRTLVDQACRGGARQAVPGEFTLRAFLNGRIDLTRAEAAGDMVRARSALGLQVSANQLRGRLHGEIAAIKEEIVQVAALVAAGIDFPEEDVVFAHREELAARLTTARERLTALVKNARTGMIVREGLAVAIIGRPNVGKSSLLNALLREKRAIVTDIPGTTRDTVEEAMDIAGLMVRLVDTAGIRATEDQLEQEGVTRARAARAQADLVLLVLDGSEPLNMEDETLLNACGPDTTLAVINKIDRLKDKNRVENNDGKNYIAPEWEGRLHPVPSVSISALTGEGLENLEAGIRGWALREDRPRLEDAAITNQRQEQAARRALEAVHQSLEALEQNRGEELLAIDLEGVLSALGDIVGETTPDDLLHRIFAEFCIGK